MKSPPKKTKKPPPQLSITVHPCCHSPSPDRWVLPRVLFVSRTDWWSLGGRPNLFSSSLKKKRKKRRGRGRGVEGGILILCSFLRLIIHSSGSSCYRCPALHPCSSHREANLLKKKKKKKTLLHDWWSSAWQIRRKPFPPPQQNGSLLAGLKTEKQNNTTANKQPGPSFIWSEPLK